MLPIIHVALLSIHDRLQTPSHCFRGRFEVRWGALPLDHEGK